MSQIIPLRRSQVVAEPTAEYVVLQPAARHAMTALEARINDLKRIFTGPSTPAAQLSRIEALCAEAMAEIQRVRRYSR